MDMDRITQVAIRAAYAAGDVLKQHFGHLDAVTKKGAIDLVTAADLESERTIIEVIRSVFSDHAILAEESGLLEIFDWKTGREDKANREQIVSYALYGIDQ